MLLRNESRIKFSVQVNLVFDDKKPKSVEVNEGDRVLLVYRKNGRKVTRAGRISYIEAKVLNRKFDHKKTGYTAEFRFDYSEDFESKVDFIDLYDILDIRQLTDEDFAEPPTESTPVTPLNATVVGAPVVSGGRNVIGS